MRYLSIAVLWVAVSAPALADVEQAMIASTVRVICQTGDEAGSGSGFLVGASDYAVTNWHVVACTGAGGEVALLDPVGEASVPAEVRWHAETQDLAVLRLAKPLAAPAVGFASHRTVQPRDPVTAAGFPGAADTLAGTEARGVVSLSVGHISRRIRSREGVALYQIDAALNPGNSGGPLFNAYGEVIGITVAKALAVVPVVSESGIALQRLPMGEGIGWAIQADELLPVLDRLGLPYRLSKDRPSALGRLWRGEPLLVTVLMATLLTSGLALAGTHRGRRVVREGLTRRLGQRRAPAPSPARQPLLVGLAGPYAGQCVALVPGEPLALGRDPRVAQLVMPSEAERISKRHLVIRYDPTQARFLLEDRWSTNGTFLGDVPGRPGERLPSGQEIAVPPGTTFYLAEPGYAFEVRLA